MKKVAILILSFGLFACNNSADNKASDDSIQTDSENQVEEEAYIDPTGTYELNSKTEEKDGEIYGDSGRIQIKKITDDKVAMTFETNKGAPSYNSGSFIDTLEYKNNIVIYTAPEDIDASCKITFHFDEKGITVEEKTDNPDAGCGFGFGVMADGFYKQTSSDIPVLIHPLTGEELE